MPFKTRKKVLNGSDDSHTRITLTPKPSPALGLSKCLTWWCLDIYLKHVSIFLRNSSYADWRAARGEGWPSRKRVVLFELAHDRSWLCVSLAENMDALSWNINYERTTSRVQWVESCMSAYQDHHHTLVLLLFNFQKFPPNKNLLLVKMKEKKLLKMQSLPKVLRSQAMRSTT